MSELMHFIKLPVASDLNLTSLEEAADILSENDDNPIILFCQRADYFVAQKIYKQCGIPRYSRVPECISNDQDAWMLVGEKLIVYSEGA